jgi:hypothetical protein
LPVLLRPFACLPQKRLWSMICTNGDDNEKLRMLVRDGAATLITLAQALVQQELAVLLLIGWQAFERKSESSPG